MSRTNLRSSGIALIGAVAIGSLLHPAAATATSATMTQGPATPVADAVASLQQPGRPASPGALATGHQFSSGAPAVAAIPTLSHLAIPAMAVAASSQGYALRDLLVDAAPDLVSRDLAFVVQRRDGEQWADVRSGTTSTEADTATVPNLPAGTYRVVLPAQLGMAQFESAPFDHQPRQLRASISFTPGDVRTLVDVNPDPDAGGTYSFTLQQQTAAGWRPVGDFATGDAAGSHAFTDLASGTYRVVVPDQANAMGTTSNEVGVTSAADQRAAAARATAAAAEREAAARAAAAAPRPVTSRPSSPSAPAPAPPPSAAGGGIVGTALAQVGDAYRLGATGPDAFDCSGLTSYAYRAAGIAIPRTASAQYSASRKVSDPQPGDLVFFLNGAQHVGIYLGGGRMVHAANPGRGVEVTSISSGWYARSFTGYGRY